MKAGGAFLFPVPSEHLWIVLTNPDSEGYVLVVNITTAYSDDKDRMDTTVDLNPGDIRSLRKSHMYITGRL